MTATIQPIINFLVTTVLPEVTNVEQTQATFKKIFAVPSEAMPSINYPWCTLYEAPGVQNNVDFFANDGNLEEYFALEIVVAVANPTQVNQVTRLPLMRGWRLALAKALVNHYLADNGSGSLLGGAPGWGSQGALLSEKIGPIPWAKEAHWGARYWLYIPVWNSVNMKA